MGAGAFSSAPSARLPTAPACDVTTALSAWSLSRRAAELVLVPVPMTRLAGAGPDLAMGAGGIVLFGAGGPADLAAQLSALTASAPPAIAPMVAVDEEGGGIQRVANLVGSLPCPRQMAQLWSPATTRARVAVVARAMRALGITADLAPVLDTDAGPGPDRLDADGRRAFSDDPAVVEAYGQAFVDGLGDGGVLAVGKHFPGHGHAHPNTDTGPALTPPLTALQTHDLLPFKQAVIDGIPAVMVGGMTVPGLTTGPADLSPSAVSGLLRTRLGFDGLVVTDALDQAAVAATGRGPTAAAEAAVEAGADLVEFSSPVNLAAVVDQLVGAVQAGRLAVTRLDDAVAAVLAAKQIDPCSIAPQL